MPRWIIGTDHSNRVVIRPEITRVYCAARRTWNDHPLVVTVETRDVPDGTALVAAVALHAAPDVRLLELPAAHVVQCERCVIEHRLTLDHASLARASLGASEGAEFCVVAEIKRFRLAARSGPLYVALGRLRYSG